jgi:hypothetical protein
MQLRNSSHQSRNPAESPSHRAQSQREMGMNIFMASHEVRIPEEQELEEEGCIIIRSFESFAKNQNLLFPIHHI